MFDEQPDGDPHGECAAEIHNLRHLLGQCYAKLMKFGVENSDPFLMDELKLTLMQCYDEPAVPPAPTFAMADRETCTQAAPSHAIRYSGGSCSIDASHSAKAGGATQ